MQQIRLPLAMVLVWIGLAGMGAASAEEKIGELLKGTLSPDRRLGAQIEEEKDPQGGSGFEVQLVEVKSRAVVLRLGEVGRPWLDSVRLVWAPDGRRFAFVYRSRRGDWTNLFVRKGTSFEDVTMPTLPSDPNPRGRANAKTIEASYTALRWIKPNVLLLENKWEDDDGIGATRRYTLTFDSEDNVKIARSAEPKKR